MPLKRNIPADGLGSDFRTWSKHFDLSQRVVVYWITAPETFSVVGYYDSVSDGNAAALSNVAANGAYPKVAINWWHSTITQKSMKPHNHPDASADLPSWIDDIERY